MLSNNASMWARHWTWYNGKRCRLWLDTGSVRAKHIPATSIIRTEVSSSQNFVSYTASWNFMRHKNSGHRRKIFSQRANNRREKIKCKCILISNANFWFVTVVLKFVILYSFVGIYQRSGGKYRFDVPVYFYHDWSSRFFQNTVSHVSNYTVS